MYYLSITLVFSSKVLLTLFLRSSWCETTSSTHRFLCPTSKTNAVFFCSSTLLARNPAAMEQSIHSDDGDLTAIVRAGFSLSTKSAVNSSSQFRIPPIFSDFTQGGISSSLQNNTTSCHFSNPNSSSGTYNISFSSSASAAAAAAAAAAAVPTSTTITTTTQHIMPNLNDVMKGPYHNMSYGGHHFMKQTYEAATRPPLSPSLSSFSFSSNPSSSSSSSSPSASIPVMKTRETKRRYCNKPPSTFVCVGPILFDMWVCHI